MYAEFAKIGGMPLDSQLAISVDGEGPIAAMMAKMGGVSTTTVIDSVDAAPLDDALFQVPAGYKPRQRE